jgi:hypothetical protein
MIAFSWIGPLDDLIKERSISVESHPTDFVPEKTFKVRSDQINGGMNENRCERGEEEGGPPESSQQTFVAHPSTARVGLCPCLSAFHSVSPFSSGSFVRQPLSASETAPGQDLFSFHKTQRSERRSSSNSPHLK